MTWHPLTLMIRLLDLISWLVFAAAALRLLAVLPNWRPAAADARQLRNERAVELVGFQGRWVLALQAAGFVALLVGISNVWPGYVPGAMCGTGVLQAMGPAGVQTLALRGLTLLLLYCWLTVEQLDQRHPEAVAVELHGRLLLLAAPLIALAGWSLARALAAVTTQEPVSCCALVYDRIAFDRSQPLWGAIAPKIWTGLGMIAAAWSLGWGWVLWRRPFQQAVQWGFWPALGVLTGLPLLYGAATRVVAPYIFEVLWHPCPWCLLLTEYGCAGMVYLGLPLWVAAQSTAGWLAGRVGRTYPQLRQPAAERIRCAGRRMVFAMLAWAALAVAPALIWRWRFGAWIY